MTTIPIELWAPVVSRIAHKKFLHTTKGKGPFSNMDEAWLTDEEAIRIVNSIHCDHAERGYENVPCSRCVAMAMAREITYQWALSLTGDAKGSMELADKLCAEEELRRYGGTASPPAQATRGGQ